MRDVLSFADSKAKVLYTQYDWPFPKVDYSCTCLVNRESVGTLPRRESRDSSTTHRIWLNTAAFRCFDDLTMDSKLIFQIYRCSQPLLRPCHLLGMALNRHVDHRVPAQDLRRDGRRVPEALALPLGAIFKVKVAPQSYLQWRRSGRPEPRPGTQEKTAAAERLGGPLPMH